MFQLTKTSFSYCNLDLLETRLNTEDITIFNMYIFVREEIFGVPLFIMKEADKLEEYIDLLTYSLIEMKVFTANDRLVYLVYIPNLGITAFDLLEACKHTFIIDGLRVFHRGREPDMETVLETSYPDVTSYVISPMPENEEEDEEDESSLLRREE